MLITFGKYKNKEINQVDDSYLKWGVENLNNEWQEHFKNELFLRTAKKVVKNHENAFSKLTDRTYDALIFGKDSTEYITNISYKDGMIYKYLSTGKEIKEVYKPWCLNIYKEGTKLNGNQFYNYISDLEIDNYNYLKNKWDKSRWFPRSIEEGYMIKTGTTLFKNLKTTDIKLHSFDIETTSIDPKDKNAQVVLISNTIRKNGIITRRLFDIQEYEFNETNMIKAWCDYVRGEDCDVLIGHNVFGFDLHYLGNRAKLNLGRDGSEIVFNEKVSKLRKDGNQSYEYHEAFIQGRTIIDTFFLSMKYDVSRYFPSYGLKAIEKHLKLVDETRIEWDFKKQPPRDIYKNKDGTWDRFKEYCRQDSDTPIKLFETMIPSFFYMNQSVPKTFQQMINEATGSQLDSIMIRSYLQDGMSIPKSSEKIQFEGAISMGIPGVYNAARKVDVTSLYPSIMLQYEIYDKKKDPNKNLIKILDYFRTERINNKTKYKQTSDSYYDDLQGSQKIMINSLYGYMGAGYLLFNYPEGAAEVTKKGREILQTAILWATGHTVKKDIKKVVNKGKENEENDYHWVLDEKIADGKGYDLINCDTDSITYTNGKTPSSDEFINELAEINKLYPEHIKFEDDGIFDKVIVSKAKNYIMKKGDKLNIKGSSFKSSNKEPILKKMNDDIINEMLGSNNLDTIKDIYLKYVEFAKNITDITMWASKKTYTDTMEKSDRLNETKVIDAIKEGLDKKVLKSIQQGDKIYVYQKLDGMKQKIVKGEPQFYKRTGEPKLEPNPILRLVELFDNDAHSEHYIERVKATLSILENVLPVKDIING